MEKEFINIIKNTLNSKYIGDDCAYLKDLNITISQDSLVEDIHFIRNKITPFELGWKSAVVNISDICASGAKPKYMTIALSLPKNINEEFIKEFYNGVSKACKKFGKVEVVGGDLTSADKIFISATVIGTTTNRNISSRSNAKVGQKIVISGNHGSSAVGLKLLLNGNTEPKEFIKSHLLPTPQLEFSKLIATTQQNEYAMMDTSDGLMDALSQISQASNVLMEINFDKIPFDEKIKIYPNWQDLILFGGEDYGIIATVDTPPPNTITIGEVKSGMGIKVDNKLYSPKEIEEKIYKHFN